MHTDLKPINKDASNHVLTNLEKLEKKTAEERLKFMDEDRYEEMITKWAYFCLKEDSNKKYEDVFRYGVVAMVVLMLLLSMISKIKFATFINVNIIKIQ